jgi:hypothetical protein
MARKRMEEIPTGTAGDPRVSPKFFIPGRQLWRGLERTHRKLFNFF